LPENREAVAGEKKREGRMKKILVIGAGPAGLTAAEELVRRSDMKPVVVDGLSAVGGLARTVEHDGNRMDIGGHRFFSKSDWVMDWWAGILKPPAKDAAPGEVPAEDDVLLLRSRRSRILYLRKFFDYPVSLSLPTLKNLGVARTLRIGTSYLAARIRPRRPVASLEDFFVDRFGDELYRTFFKDYTEKVWGVPCRDISPSWGAQRVKGLTIAGVLKHAFGQIFRLRSKDVAQKKTETSLIERFLYPKFGPGQLWQKVAENVAAAGGEIRLGTRVRKLFLSGGRIVGAETENVATGAVSRIACDAVVSTMPMRDLVASVEPPPAAEVRRVAEGLCYRDFLTVGLLVRKFKSGAPPPDNWIYIQEPDVRIGRLQIFNNWSPALVRDPGTVWLGLEYFCREGDDLWSMPDADMAKFAAGELEKIGLIEAADVIDSHVVRVPKAYPSYFGSYKDIAVVQRWADGIANLYPAGRNGMHRYNNQDHSMLTARLAVDHLLGLVPDKAAVWSINAEEAYHEEKA
jgi:protoporphyrinogen oxidase